MGVCGGWWGELHEVTVVDSCPGGGNIDCKKERKRGGGEVMILGLFPCGRWVLSNPFACNQC